MAESPSLMMRRLLRTWASNSTCLVSSASVALSSTRRMSISPRGAGGHLPSPDASESMSRSGTFRMSNYGTGCGEGMHVTMSRSVWGAGELLRQGTEESALRLLAVEDDPAWAALVRELLEGEAGEGGLGGGGAGGGGGGGVRPPPAGRGPPR